MTNERVRASSGGGTSAELEAAVAEIAVLDGYKKTLIGTTNQVTLTSDVDQTSITFSLPQSIAPSSSPSFATLTATTQLIGKGTATNDEPTAGYIGEYKETVVAVGSQVSMVASTWKTVASISLTAGDWDLTGIVIFNGDGTTTVTATAVACHSVDNGVPPNQYFNATPRTATVPAINVNTVAPTRRVLVAGTTTYYLVAFVTFGVANMNCYGTIRARRMR